MSKKVSKNTTEKARKTGGPSQNFSRSNSGYDFAGRIRKCCISWQESVEKWERVNRCGLELATKVVNEQLQKSEEGGSEFHSVSSISLDRGETGIEVENDKEKFVKSLHSLQEIQEKMCSLTSNFEAILSLYEMKEKSTGSGKPIFHSWPLSRFVDLSKKIASMFEQELRLKEKLVEMILGESGAGDRNKSMAFLAMWLHQPYLDDDFKDELELMQLETGLKML